METMICPNGHENPRTNTFCGDCGAPLQPADVLPALPIAPSDATPTRAMSSRKPYVVLGILAGLALIVLAYFLFIGGSGGGLLAPKHTLTGQFDLFQDTDYLAGESFSSSNFDTFRDECEGAGGYSDLAQGVSVLVYNENGRILATVPLGPGKPLKEIACEFSFKVSGLPDAKSYSVEISHRGKITYTKAELDRNHWQVSLSIGT